MKKVNTPHPAVVRALADAGVMVRTDAAGRLVIGRFAYEVESRRGVRRETLGPLIASLRDKTGRWLLVTEYLTPPAADELRRHGIQFADAAGNAFLRERGLFVHIAGRKPAVTPPAEKPLRVFRPAGIKIAFALLSVPDLLQASQREIANAAGVALGSVPMVLAGLRELGFVAELNAERRLVRRDRLIDQWTEAYVRLLHPKLILGRFTASDPNWWKHTKLTAFDAQWGGETAAAVLQRHLVPENTIVYAERLPSNLLSRQRMKSDPQGRIVIRRRFWHFDVTHVRPDVVPPLLVYADLVADGDPRALEAARKIRGEYVD